MSTQEAWQAASDSEAKIDLDDDSLNPHFAYDDEDAHVRHQVWFLDAVTVLNEMRAARALGIQTFALWRLGSEDNSMWKIWDHPLTSIPVKDLADSRARLRRRHRRRRRHPARHPQAAERPAHPSPWTTTLRPRRLPHPSLRSRWTRIRSPYTVEQYGYHPKEVALSFDDGPDPTWTPKILDILKQYHVIGTFFMIGEEAEDNIGADAAGLPRRPRDRQPHLHPSGHQRNLQAAQVDLELNLTERLFASELGVQPLYFRPPYSIDQEPDTNDQAAPVERIQQPRLRHRRQQDRHQRLGRALRARRRRRSSTASSSRSRHGDASRGCKGSIILLHDGGGDRQATVDALPMLIEALRAHGYKIVPVSELVGKTRAEVMPPLDGAPALAGRASTPSPSSSIGFFNHFVIDVFFVGDILMSVRLIIIGIFAIIDRFRKRKNYRHRRTISPRVAVLIPAYNEEKVIVRTIRSVMMSNYKNIRIIVIDDGSTRQHLQGRREAYPARHRLRPPHRPHQAQRRQGRRAELRPRADRRRDLHRHRRRRRHRARRHQPTSFRHFANPKIGAVAGNAKVGNRVNLWTRWQALEYITSQNFERRALDLFDVVMVVPGAHRRLAHRCRQSRRRLPLRTPSPKTPTSP